jgi:hypothetical protein
VTIGINNDTQRESDEAFLVELTNPKGGATIDGPFSNNTSFVVIIDDDYEAGVLSLVEGEYVITEGEAVFSVPVRRIGGSQGRVELEYEIRENSDGNDSGDLVVGGKLFWSNQETVDKSIDFEVPSDELVNLDREYQVVLSNPTGTESKKPRLGMWRSRLVVANDDRYGELAFASADYFVTENGGEFLVSVLRLNGIAEEVSVEYEVSAGPGQSEGFR